MMKAATDGGRPGPVRGATVDYVLDYLRDGIARGRFAPGQRLIEADLTSELGVSRGPLREALRRLSADDLLEMVPNRGAIVRRLSLREMLELFAIRIALEGMAARDATACLGDPTIRAEFEAGTRMIWSDEVRMPGPDYLHENQAFHQAVTRASGNDRLMALVGQLNLPLIMIQLSSWLTKGTIAQSLVEHRAIATAMLAQDGDAAEGHAKQHLVRARSVVQAMPAEFFRG